MYLLSADPLTALLAMGQKKAFCLLQYGVEYGVEYGRASLRPPVLSCVFNPSRGSSPVSRFFYLLPEP